VTDLTSQWVPQGQKSWSGYVKTLFNQKTSFGSRIRRRFQNLADPGSAAWGGFDKDLIFTDQQDDFIAYVNHILAKHFPIAHPNGRLNLANNILYWADLRLAKVASRTLARERCSL